MPNYVNVLDVLNYNILNGGSQYLTDEDVWFWDYHLSKPHVTGEIAFVPSRALNQIDATFEEIDTTGISENLTASTNYYYATPDYTKGVFLLSKTSKSLYYLDMFSSVNNQGGTGKVVVELPKTGTMFQTMEGSQFKGKLLEFRPATNWLFYANTAEQILYKYDISDTRWSALSAFPTGWQINSEPQNEVTLLVDQVTNDLYVMFRNLYVISAANKTIYYTYRVFKYDLTANVWVQVIAESSFDLYRYGINTVENPHTPGRCVIHNGKLFVTNLFTEVFPTGAPGRVLYLSFIVINLTNGAIEKNDWTPIYQQTQSCTGSLQITRFGNYIALITPDCPNSCIMIDPVSYGISYLRIGLGAAQGTNTIRCMSNYALASANNVIYDIRERKTYPLSWTNAQLVADYSFDDQIYTDSIQFKCNSSEGLEVYIDVGTGSYTLATSTYNAQSGVYVANVKTYLKRFRVAYTQTSGNANNQLYKLQVLADPTHIWIVNSIDTRIDSDQFNNIVVGTPTSARLYKVQNKTGFTTTAVRVFIEADGDTGSYFTEISSSSDVGFKRHCNANTGTTCSKGFSYGSRDCASGRCGGYDKAILLPTPQSLPPNSSALFYVRVNVPTGQTRINRQARVICQLEY